MKIRHYRFNTYFLTGLFVALTLFLTVVTGCTSSEKKKKGYTKRDQASLRLYLEVNNDGSDRSGMISVGRQAPFQVNVEKKAFLTEHSIEHASVVDSFGGFS